MKFLAKKGELKRSGVLILFSLFGLMSNAQLVQEDFEALKALYQSTNGANWYNNNNWDINASHSDVKNWYGITIENSRVTRIDLQKNNLSGFLPAELGKLTALSYLNIRWNNIFLIPPQIRNCVSLDYISIGNNPIHEIPAELFNLPVLRTLGLAEMPVSVLPKEIGNLTSLSRFALYRTDISVIPEELFNCTNMDTLQIPMSNISHISSKIDNLKKITFLDLSYNQLSDLPNMEELTELKEVYLSGNQLTFSDLQNCRIDFTAISKVNLENQSVKLSINSIIDHSGKVHLFVNEAAEGNIFQWYKNDEIIPNSNKHSLILPLSKNMFEEYYCLINNPKFPGLTLSSDKYIINEGMQIHDTHVYYVSLSKPLYKKSVVEICDKEGNVLHRIKLKRLIKKSDLLNNNEIIIKLKNEKEQVDEYRIFIE